MKRWTLLLGLLAAASAASGASIDRERLKRTIAEHREQITPCYESALGEKPDLEGIVRVRFLIQPDGKVSEAKVESHTLDSPELETCLLEKVKDFTFPRWRGQPISILYPFIFRLDKADAGT